MNRVALAFMLMVPILAFCQSDKRTVGGITVDLQPIHEWEQTKKGERPLAHWKDADLKKIIRPLFGGHECMVEIDGKTQTVVIMHLPQKLVQLDAKQSQRLKTIAALADQIRKAQKTAEDAGDQYSRTSSEADRIRSVDASENLRHLNERATDVRNAYIKDEMLLKAMKQLLIMDTGRAISGKHIWEHGQSF